jgi:cation diffusion facilitator family transporter
LLALYQYKQGKRINSSMLTANAINMRNDVLISVGVLIGLIFTFVLQMPVLDAITGLLISLFIIKSAIGIFMDSNIELMDGVADTSLYDKIFEAVAQVEGASNPHRVRLRLIGSHYAISLDIEADGNITLNEAHNIAEAVENSICHSIDNVYDIVVHVEPIGKHSTSGEKFGLEPGKL